MARTILVTGSASGIGRATSDLLQLQGNTVIQLDIKDADIEVDLATANGRDEGIAQTIKLSGGKLDAIIACAGLAGADAKAMVAVNYFGTVAIVEGLHGALASSGAPRVVIISSLASVLPIHRTLVDACLLGDEAAAMAQTSAGDVLAYASTKRALSCWIRRTAILPEWAGNGILINGIAPGTVRTPMTAHILATDEGRAMLAQVTPIAVKDLAEPEDIAPVLAFLGSPECRYMVGQTIFVDGGADVILRGERHV